MGHTGTEMGHTGTEMGHTGTEMGHTGTREAPQAAPSLLGGQHRARAEGGGGGGRKAHPICVMSEEVQMLSGIDRGREMMAEVGRCCWVLTEVVRSCPALSA
eukprot:371708-Rhodomonas_salina.2